MVAAGDALLAPAITRRLIAEFARAGAAPPGSGAGPADVLDRLTPREREILGLWVAKGLSNTEIASSWDVSEKRETHVGSNLRQLGLRDRAQLVVIAYQSGLVRA